MSFVKKTKKTWSIGLALNFFLILLCFYHTKYESKLDHPFPVACFVHQMFVRAKTAWKLKGILLCSIPQMGYYIPQHLLPVE